MQVDSLHASVFSGNYQAKSAQNDAVRIFFVSLSLLSNGAQVRARMYRETYSPTYGIWYIRRTYTELTECFACYLSIENG